MRDHNYQSRTNNYHTRFIPTVENEKSLYEKKNHHSRISISFFFWAAKPKQSAESILKGLPLILRMAEQLSRRRLYRSCWFSTEYCWKNRFSLSCIWSCRIRNLCKKVQGTDKNAYRHITVTKFLSTRSVWGVRSVFRYVIEKDVRYLKCVQDSSKGEPSIGILGEHRRKTGVHYYKGNDRATSWD